ncbi:unnamed protein product [Phytophthora lilii]|uniref:Unnamed protein product n=1 Tax=Phytophthora lilii TaxID=2077276 RepID=A0A9W6U2T1_9STRA|nr:unnamed protein product [Phytophthora lilii]
MVYMPSAYLASAAAAFVALQMQQTSATSLQYDPYTTCTSYDIGNQNFPGRGSEIVDDGTCTITVPEDPNLPKTDSIATVSVTYVNLLSNKSASPAEPISSKVGTAIISEETPPAEAKQDAYVMMQGSTATSLTSVSTGSTRRRLELASSDDIAVLEDYFGTPMERKLANLPTSAVYTPSPWAGSNWPAYLDSINYEWNQGQLSPAEKYAKAFGLDVKAFMDSVSAQNGIEAHNYLAPCASNTECYDPNVDTVCAKRANATSGYCIPTWFGICHAWSPAAILESEPNCPVTYNGITFQPMDIKALVTDIYVEANISTVFTGSRFSKYHNDSIDEYGSHTDYSYRDLNPGFLHVAASNLLGKLNTTFIIDRDAGDEVWNQPVVGFKVYEQTAMTTEKAANTFYGLEEYPWNANASSIVYVKSRLSWINETLTDGGLVASGLNENFTTGAYYDYLLELDEAEEIIGGEWLYGSNDNHPDFLWFARGKPLADTVTSIGLSYANVTMLLEQSVACSKSGSTPLTK